MKVNHQLIVEQAANNCLTGIKDDIWKLEEKWFVYTDCNCLVSYGDIYFRLRWTWTLSILIDFDDLILFDLFILDN